MPGLGTTYEQGLKWKVQPIRKAQTDFLADKGIMTWVWQAGGVASRSRPIVAPEDAKGLKVRGGSREMDMVLQTAGAAVLSVPSSELYAAMQTGACDAAGYSAQRGDLGHAAIRAADDGRSGRAMFYS